MPNYANLLKLLGKLSSYAIFRKKCPCYHGLPTLFYVKNWLNILLMFRLPFSRKSIPKYVELDLQRDARTHWNLILPQIRFVLVIIWKFKTAIAIPLLLFNALRIILHSGFPYFIIIPCFFSHICSYPITAYIRTMWWQRFTASLMLSYY